MLRISLPATGYRILGVPAYFARHGTPRMQADLAGHACLRYKFPTTGKLQPWPLDERTTPAPATATLVSNNIDGLIEAARDGLGRAWLPDFFVKEECAAGTLISVIWPSSRHLSPKIRVFVEYLCAHAFADSG